MTNINRAAEFTRFYEATRTLVYRAVLLSRAGAQQDSEDAVSEAYARAYLRWDRLSTHPNPTAWVIRTALNHRVSLWRQGRAQVDSANTTKPLHSEALDPALVKVIRRLPKGQREILALRILLDFSTEQTADILGVKPGTVKKQLHRALQAIRGDVSIHDAQGAWQ